MSMMKKMVKRVAVISYNLQEITNIVLGLDTLPVGKWTMKKPIAGWPF